MNNDYLGLHYQVIDRDVISLGDGQWHSIRDFRRDSPTERPDTGNSDDGTRQDIREHDTATHCIHEFSPSSECFSSAAEPQHLYICRVKSLGSLQRFKLSSTFCIEALQNHAHLIQIALSINQGIHPGKSGFFLSTRAQDIGIMRQIAFRQFPIADPVSTQSCGLISDDSGTGRAVSLSSPLRNHSFGFVGRRSNVKHSRTGDLMCISRRSFRLGNCASAAAFSSRRVDMQHRSEGRTGSWLAAGYAMCFRCQRNRTTIRLHRHNQAAWSRCRRHKRRNAVLGGFCAKQPNRQGHAERQLCRCERQRCRGPGSRR
jgi:hypothetical protein